jgi:hypothetical protein
MKYFGVTFAEDFCFFVGVSSLVFLREVARFLGVVGLVIPPTPVDAFLRISLIFVIRSLMARGVGLSSPAIEHRRLELARS